MEVNETNFCMLELTKMNKDFNNIAVKIIEE